MVGRHGNGLEEMVGRNLKELEEAAERTEGEMRAMALEDEAGGTLVL